MLTLFFNNVIGLELIDIIFIDTIFLTLILLPALYIFLYKPLNTRLEEQKKVKQQLDSLLEAEGKADFVGIIRDISNRKATEQEITELNRTLEQKDIHQSVSAKDELERNIQRYKALVKNSSEGIFVLDPNDYSIQEANEKFLTMLGYAEEEITSVYYRDIAIVPDAIYERFISNLLYSGEDQHVRRKYKRKDGTLIEVEVSASLISVGSENVILLNVKDLTEERKKELALNESFERLKVTLDETVNALMIIAEKRDPYTAGHQLRVADLACVIGKEIGFTKERLAGLRIAGILHDIGKIYVPTDILNKPGQLSEMEMGIIKVHPEISYDIIKKIPFETPVAEMVRQHHERINGSGYPRGLQGDEMLLEAKILAVADVVEAMASHRPYRPAIGLKVALDEITKNKGVIYDSDVVEACLKVFQSKGYDLEQVN